MPQFCKSKSMNKSVEMNLSIMLPLASHNLKCVLTVLKYASPVMGVIPKYLVQDMQRVQNLSLSLIGIMKAGLSSR